MASVIDEYNIPSDDDDDNDNSDEDVSGSSDDESESGDDDEEEAESEDEGQEIESKSRDNTEYTALSSEEDPEREGCPICLNKFIGQDLGTPESCEHTFCFDCIEEWSKNINTCPIDRTQFNNIQLRATPGGNVLRKVKVRVRPKEPEETLQESVTLCEVCRCGDREDRLLLCDGCDLAYHCECLDPPLFYIPIEEWFCPPCSGVFPNRAVAGPSGSRRRVIPRTRASEAVRSRVQNLRSGGRTASRSTSRSKKATSTASPKKRRRRTYRKTFKKVVQLARTMKDMSHGSKSKVGARGSTVIVTYKRRKRRRKRRSTKGKLSRRSVASTRALSVPSAQQRIAKSLGISKPLEGSTIPQVKQPSGSRISRVSKMPSHALFGNHNQLMDFDEDFNEDVNKPSTSKAVSPPKRPSNDSSSGLSLLDSIIAGQKILHCKSDKIFIKTDGSLILKDKESTSSFKKTENSKKVETGDSSRTPMSVALVKTGVKNLILTSNKNSSVRQKDASSSKSKQVGASNTSTSSSKEKTSSKTNSSGDRWFSKSNCSNSKAGASSSFVRKNNDKESSGKTSAFNKAAKIFSETSNKEKNTGFVENIDSLMDGFDYDTPSDWELEITDKHQSSTTCKPSKNNLKSHLAQENSSSNSTSSISKLRQQLQKTPVSDVTKSTSVVQIKSEVLSDDETDVEAAYTSGNIDNVKKEVLSDEETNMDTWLEKARQENNCNKTTHPIKSESLDSDSEPDVLKNHSLDLQRILSDSSKRNCSNESEVSDYETSQSLIDIVPKNLAQSSVNKTFKNKVDLPIKVKEEPQSDSEDYSESLVSTADVNSLSLSVSSNQANSTYNSSFSHKGNKHFDDRKNMLLNSELKQRNSRLPSNMPLENKQNKGSSDNSILKKKLSSLSSETLSTEAGCHSTAGKEQNISVDVNNLSEDDDFPCTQPSSPAIMDSSSEDEAGSDGTVENDNISSTQAIFPEDIPSEDDDIPSAQKNSPVLNNNLSDEEDLFCTQAVSPAASDNPSDDEDLPCTQAVPPAASDNLFDDEDSPCTQAASFSSIKPNLNEDEDLPPTQVMSFPVHKNKTFSNTCSSNNDSRAKNINASSAQFTPLRNDHNFKNSFKIPSVPVCKVPKNTSLDSSIKLDQCSFDELPPTQANFEFLKPTALSKKDTSSVKKCDKTIFTANSSTTDETVKKLFPSNIKNKCNSVLINTDNELDTQDLPATQIFSSEAATLSDTLLNEESFDLPATQVSSIPANNHSIATNKSPALAEPQICSYKVRKLHDREEESLDLPATQVIDQISRKINQPSDSNLIDGSFSLPATQIFNPSSNVGSEIQKQFDDISDEIFSLPATQVSIPKDSRTHKPNQNSNELLSLQNQKSGRINKDITRNKLDKNCNENKLSASAYENSNSVKHTSKLSDSQLLDLPATQLSHENSNLSTGPSESSKSNNSHKKLESEAKKEKEEGNKLKDIMSNIKLLVSSLSAKDPEMPIFDSDENANNENPLPDIQDASESTEVVSATTNDCDNADVENFENEETNLDNFEKLSHAELKEIASKSNSEVPDKSVGIHRHLPQVIAKLPVKVPVKIKPSYKKTFSFEEVSKTKGMGETSNDSLADSVEDELPPTQRVDFNNLNAYLDSTKNLPNKFTETASDDSSNTQLFKNALRYNVSSLKVSKTHSYATDSNNKSKSLERCSSVKEVSNEVFSDNSNQEDLTAIRAFLEDENYVDLEEHGSHSNKDKSSKEKRNGNIITIRNKNKSPDISNEDDLPATQALFDDANHLGTSSKIEKHGFHSNINKNSKEKRNANIITIKNKNKPSDNSKEDDLPATQALFSGENHLGISSHTKKDGFHSNISKNSEGKRNGNITTIRSKKKSSDKSDEDDLPATQALFGDDIPLGLSSNTEKHSSHSSLSKTSKEKRNANIITIRNRKKSFDNSNEEDLPATQALFHCEKGYPSSENSKNKRSGNTSITVGNSTASKFKNQKESKKYLDSLDHNDQDAAKSFKHLEEKSSHNSKHSKENNTKSKYFHSDKSEVNVTNELSRINAFHKPQIGNRTRNISSHNKSLESIDSELDDLPATQVWISENSSDSNLSSRHGQNNGNSLDKYTKDISIANRCSTSLFKKPSDGKSSNHGPSKRKNSYEDELHKSKKKNIDQRDVSLLPDGKVVKPRDSNGTVKGNYECQMNNKEMVKVDKSLLSKKMNQTLNKAQNDRRLEKDSRSLPPTYQQKESNKTVNNVQNCPRQDACSVQANISQGIKIKQEKMDSGFAEPSVDTPAQNLANSSNITINGVRIKTENLSDSLPETQVFNHNGKESDHNSAIIDNHVPLLSSIKKEICSDDRISCIEKENNNLTAGSVQLTSSIKKEVCSDDEISVIEEEKNVFTVRSVQLATNIKREVCSDDEVSIIEVEDNHKEKVEEEIVIDDDEIENAISLAAKMNTVTNCQKVPIQTASLTSTIKKEKCLEGNEVAHKTTSQRLDVLSKQTKMKDSSNVSDKDKKRNKHTSKNNEKGPRLADKDKNFKDSFVAKNKRPEKDKSHESKSKRSHHEYETKNAEKSKNSGRDLPEININKKNLQTNSLKEKRLLSDSKNPLSSDLSTRSSSKSTSKHHPEAVQNQPEKSKAPSDKLKVMSWEKENTSAVKNNEIFITVKSHKKRSLENGEDKNIVKRGKYSLDSDSCSSDSSFNQRTNSSSFNCVDSNRKSKSCDLMDDKLSSSTPRSDISMDSVKASKHQGIKYSLSHPFNEDKAKIFTKQDLKEEIANEVKLVLKPFFNTGLISKENYKDIMRRAVPKIFKNCHNLINPEKISKLVLSYVALLNKS